MTHCHKCSAKLIKGAKFCHNCGAEVVLRLSACPSCNVMNPLDAVFCFACGHSLTKVEEEEPTYESKKSKKKQKTNKKAKAKPYQANFPIQIKTDSQIAEQIKTHFFQNLRTTVDTISKPNAYNDYVDIFYKSGFNYYFDQQRTKLVKDIKAVPLLYPNATAFKVDELLEEAFDNMINRFVILHTSELNTMPLTNRLLTYENIKWDTVNKANLILDYLNIDDKTEKVYTDFIKLSPTKLKNACKSFLFAENSEKLILLSDQTMFGSCKEGYAFTDRGLYWKVYFNKPKQIQYNELLTVKKEQDWLRLNGHYFHVNKEVNYRVMKLLQKIRRLISK